MFQRDVKEYFQISGYPVFTLAMMGLVVSSTGIRDAAEVRIPVIPNWNALQLILKGKKRIYECFGFSEARDCVQGANNGRII